MNRPCADRKLPDEVGVDDVTHVEIGESVVVPLAERIQDVDAGGAGGLQA